MANVSKISFNGEALDIKDSYAREQLEHLTANNYTADVTGDYTVNAGDIAMNSRNATMHTTADRTIDTDGNDSVHIDGASTLNVGGLRTETFAGDKTEAVTGTTTEKFNNINTTVTGKWMVNLPSRSFDMANVALKTDTPPLPFVQPEQFGAKGDGVTDDYNAIMQCIAYAETNKIPIVFKPVTYIVGKPLLMNEVNIDFNFCTLKNTNSDLDYTIKIGDNGTTIANIPIEANLTNLTIDCNGRGGISVKGRHIKLFNMNILNIGTVGLANLLGYENSFNTIYFTGDRVHSNVGYLAKTGDAEIYNFTGVNLMTAIDLYHDQRILNAHFWIGDINLYRGSVFCKCHIYNAAHFVSSNCDTYETFLDLSSTNIAPGWVLTNVDVIYNLDFVPDDADTVAFRMYENNWIYNRPYAYRAQITNCNITYPGSKQYRVSNVDTDKYIGFRTINTNMNGRTLDAVQLYDDFTNNPTEGSVLCKWGDYIDIYIDTANQYNNGTFTESGGNRNKTYYGFTSVKVPAIVVDSSTNEYKIVLVQIACTENKSSFYITSSYRLKSGEHIIIKTVIPLTEAV